jgi:toxin CcdB
MSQFDVYRNPNSSTNKHIPYLLDLQTDLLEITKTRVVVPLEKCGTFSVAERLMPKFRVEGISVVMSTPELAGVGVANLGEPVVSLADKRQEIIAALDLLFSGI